MQHLLQTDPRWKNKKLGTCTDTIGQSGCFITSLAMLADKLPDEVNDILRDGGGYSNGCLVIADKAAKLLGLEYGGKTNSFKPTVPVIAETKYFAPKVPQHFFVVNPDGSIIDPLGKNINYPIISYRLFKRKETMSEPTCEAKLTAMTKTMEAYKAKSDKRKEQIAEMEAEQIKLMQEQEKAIRMLNDGCKAKIDDLTKQWITNNSYDLSDWRTCLGLLLKAIFKK